MKLPGFVAETSLYRTKRTYTMRGQGYQPSAQIAPQGFESCYEYIGRCLLLGSTIACLEAAACEAGAV